MLFSCVCVLAGINQQLNCNTKFEFVQIYFVGVYPNAPWL